MAFPLKPGFRFKEGRLLIFTTAASIALQTGPTFKAERKLAEEREWTPFSPKFRLLRPRSLERRSGGEPAKKLGPKQMSVNVVDPELARRQAFDAFRFSLLPELVSATERFPSRQWRLFRVFQREPLFLDLLRQNPALAFALAHHDFIKAGLGAVLDWASRAVRLKQREILGHLGFPDTDGCARIFTKVLPEAVHVECVNRLCGLLQDTGVHAWLAHAQQINAGVVALVTDVRLRQSVTPKLLAEVGASEAEVERPVAALLLHDLQLMQLALWPEKAPKVFQSLAKLREVHREVGVEYCGRMEQARLNCRFPPAPLPGTKEIVPLSSPEELSAEGRMQKNCVANYAKWVESGTGYIYRVLHPERATLSIMPGPGGDWQISQLLLASNRSPQRETERFVESWLRSYSLAV